MMSGLNNVGSNGKIVLLLVSILLCLFLNPEGVVGFVVNNNKNNNNGRALLKESASSNNLDDTVSEVKVGDKLPAVTLQEGQANYGKPENVDLLDLIKGKKVVIFAVPGAFTPGCSKSHLPSFMDAQSELKSKGVDMIICVATNDAYVMEAWGDSSGGQNSGIRFFSDSKAELTRSLGLAMESDVFVRCKRFSLVAEDGVVTHYFSSGDQSSDTWAPNVLSSL
eukprot:CAMPEP_0197825358 /NCGR_PEP_ID=MMETSP1437-20131217/2458_1 /TAXON_ID=49252 ORGANISM="Eucampia antarctica, Strain CCMP1452" /NCGR_SAMPLE_ID=MMETSP1437 /ASSEMBLY_ACC=CAM_ASM_001096 /LENGTH=222 /DNA_ID=CAMNT_0043425327 /DNA_START=31 /DNA_END=699 /DNA_ORIENTATION=-